MVNFKENEEPKLICDSIEKARSNEECKNNSFAVNAGQQEKNSIF